MPERARRLRQWRLYVADFSSRAGTRPGKLRPCVVVQHDAIGEAQRFPSAIVIPCTTRLAGEGSYPLRVRLPAGTAGLRADTELMVDQLLAWDVSRLREELGELPEELRPVVRQALRDVLDL